MSGAIRTFRIFLSSTLSDLKEERNALQERVFPRLRELCQRHGARFQVIDLRWGVSEEASIDQQTMKICLGEIERCQKTTPRPNFIVLLGDRYGWRPLPYEIPIDEFDEIIRNVTEAADRDLLTRWYKRDDNAVLPIYCLQPRTGEFTDSAKWELIENQLCSILLKITKELPLEHDKKTKYTASATEQEIIQGALRVQDAPEHVFCFFRSILVPQNNESFCCIKDVPLDQRFRDFADLDPEGNLDHEAYEKLNDLKSHLNHLLSKNVHNYEARWLGDNITTDHIGRLCDDVYNSLSRIIANEITKLEDVDPLNKEIDNHKTFGENRARFFIGRTDILQCIVDYIRGDDRHTLAIFGASGSGKSALMARAVELTRNEHPNAQIICRFIGATPESSNGRTLLESLCRQISRAYGMDEATVPTDYKELIEYFAERLKFATAERPLILFLDALDQLSDVNKARNLKWLPNELPEYVHFIVSTLLGDCLSALERKLSVTSLLRLEPMAMEEGSALLNLWLADAGRTLQDYQRDEVLNKFAINGLPLYLRLAFEESSRWKSYTKHEPLNTDIPGIIHYLFNRLSNRTNHGEFLVARSLGYLGAAKNGLTEDELLDILSLDEDVMADFKRRSPKSPSVNTLPVVVWSRLYFDLGPYLIERSADGTSLLAFFHRQFSEVVMANYLVEAEKLKRHSALAHYFNQQKHQIEHTGKQIFNLRKLSELPYQQRNGRMWNELEATLCDLSFIEAKCAAGRTYDLIADYNAALEPDNLPLEQRGNMESFARFLRAQSHVLVKHPALVFQQAFNEPDSTAPAQAALQRLRSGQETYSLLHRINKSQTPSPCMFTLTGHSDPVYSCDVSPDNKKIVSASSDGTLKIWNMTNGEELVTLEGHERSVEICNFSRDGTKIMSADRNGKIILWDAETGNQLNSFQGDKAPEADCNFSPDGKLIVIAGKEEMLTVWDNQTGKLIYKLEGHNCPVVACDFSPDGASIVSGAVDGRIKLWDTSIGKEIVTSHTSHKKAVWRCRFFEDGKSIVSASEDGTLKLWAASTLEELGTFAGHDKPVWACDVSPNGKWIISGSFDTTLKLWDVERKLELETFRGHEHQIWGCAFSPDGTRVVSASWDTTLKIWDIASIVAGQKSKEITLSTRTSSPQEAGDAGRSGPLLCSAISPDGRLIVAGTWDGWLRIWKKDTGEEIKQLNIQAGYVTALAFSPDGKWVLIGSDDGQLKLFDTMTWAQGPVIQEHSAQVCACSFSRDGKLIISSSRDNTLKVWEMHAEEVRQRAVLTKGDESIESCAISPDGAWVAGGTDTGRLRLWDMATKKEMAPFSGHQASVLWCQFSPDGTQLVSTSMDETIKVWNLATNKETMTLSHNAAIQTGYFSPDGTRILSASWDRTLKVWDVSTGKLLLTLSGHTDEVQDGRFSADGKQIISASLDGTLRLWDAETGAQIALFVGPTNWVKNCTFSKDGERILTCSHNRALKLWNGHNGAELSTLSGHEGEVQACAFSPDGKRLLSASSDKTLKLWDSASGKLLVTLIGHSGPVQACVFSPYDSKWIVSGSWDKTLKLWDAKTGKNLATMAGHAGWVQQVMLSCDGKWILSRSVDKTIKLWDAEKRALRTTLAHRFLIECCALSPKADKIVCGCGDKLILWNLETQSNMTLAGHKEAILCCAFSPDGGRIVSGSTDCTLKLWDASTGRELASFEGHEGWVLTCAFSPDGTQLLSGSNDNLLKLWNVATGRELCKYWVGMAVHSVIWHPSGELMAAGDSAGNLHLLRVQARRLGST